MNPKLYLERAENELELAKIIFKLTTEKKYTKRGIHSRYPVNFF
jgi:hypothetical protein